MKSFWIAVAMWMTVGTLARADEPAKKVSATFAEILTRVVSRDPDSGVITGVRVKDDAPPRANQSLRFTMQVSGDEALIQLYLNGKVWTVFESYRLVMDASMRAELTKQKLKVQLDAAKDAKLQQERAARIEKLSAGKLRYGMTKDEVIAAWGQPKEVPDNSMIQEMGRFWLVYPGYLLNFRVGLMDIVQNRD